MVGFRVLVPVRRPWRLEIKIYCRDKMEIYKWDTAQPSCAVQWCILSSSSSSCQYSALVPHHFGVLKFEKGACFQFADIHPYLPVPALDGKILNFICWYLRTITTHVTSRYFPNSRILTISISVIATSRLGRIKEISSRKRRCEVQYGTAGASRRIEPRLSGREIQVHM